MQHLGVIESGWVNGWCSRPISGRIVTGQAFQQAIEIPGYSCEGLLGHGGMGTVYRAVQLAYNRPVAVKVLAEAFRDDPDFVARFRHEAEALATLEHPNIVPLIDSGDVDGSPFIVMRLIDGPTLRTMIRAGVLDPVTALDLLTGVARALDFAHQRGCVHKDVKPHNILIEHGQHAWLADFGLTMLTEGDEHVTAPSQITGSFDYLAPEIGRGEQPGSASDIYSLAVTTFQALTGKLPFPASNVAATFTAHATAPRPAASEFAGGLPEAIDEPLRRGMAVDPAKRPASAPALLAPLCEAFGLASPERPAFGWAGALPMFGASAPDGSGRPDDSRAPDGAVQPDSVATGAVTRTATVDAGRRHVAVTLVATVVAALLVTVCVVGGSSAARRATLASSAAHLRAATHVEYPGGSSHTWSDYDDAGGNPGPTLIGHTGVLISCRVKGFEVTDGNVWWYRVASRPWDGRYYVSADAFYNDGNTRGTLLHTPYYDPKVPVCG